MTSNLSYIRNQQLARKMGTNNPRQKYKPQFDLNSLEACKYLKRYNAMRDKYCGNYFNQISVKSHLNKVGLIADGDILVER